MRIMKAFAPTAMTGALPPPPPLHHSLKIPITLAAIAVVVVAAVIVGYVATRPANINPLSSPSPSSSTPGISPNSTSQSGNASSSTPSTSATPGTSTSPSATTTPLSSAAPTSSSSTPVPSQTNSIADAESMKFSIDVTHNGAYISNITYAAKLSGQGTLLREEITTPGSTQTAIYIVNEPQQKVWVYDNGKWADLSAQYALAAQTYITPFNSYKGTLSGWSGLEDYTIIAPNGDTVRYYNIAVNPSLPDSLFQPS